MFCVTLNTFFDYAQYILKFALDLLLFFILFSCIKDILITKFNLRFNNIKNDKFKLSLEKTK